MSTSEIGPTTLVNNTVVLLVEKKLPAYYKTVRNRIVKVSASPEEQVLVDPAPSWLFLSKKLFDSVEFDFIWRADETTVWRATALCLPSPLKGVKFLPVKYVKDVEKMFRQYADIVRPELILRWIETYPKAVEEAKERLGRLFNLSDYPTVEKMQKAFKFSWKYMQLGSSASLAEIKREIFLDEQERASEAWTTADDVMKQLLRANASDLVCSLVEKMSPGIDGTRKVFRADALSPMQQFLETFNGQNIANDQELTVIVEKMRELVAGVNPDLLKSDAVVRTAFQTGFQEIQKSMDEMLVQGPVRKVRF